MFITEEQRSGNGFLRSKRSKCSKLLYLQRAIIHVRDDKCMSNSKVYELLKWF